MLLGTKSPTDLGNKLGNWTLKYQDYSKVEYTITATVGARKLDTTIFHETSMLTISMNIEAGLLEANTNYTVASIPVPVVYFDFDLSTIGDNANYQVTCTLYTTSSDGFSWVKTFVYLS